MLLFPTLAAGDELELSIGGSAEYDSNVFRSTNDEKDDVIFRVLPRADLYREEGDLRYRLSYSIPFEQGVQFGEDISDFDHVAGADASWIVDEATEIFFSDRFRYDRSVTRRFAEEDDPADVNTRRRRVLTNTATLGVNHAFSPRTTGGFTFSHSLFKTQQESRQDNQTFALSTDINYALTKRNQVGTGVSFTLQDFEEGGGEPASQSYYYNIFGSWVYRFDETTQLSISAGPTLIQIEEDRLPASLAVARTPFIGGGPTPIVFAFDTCPEIFAGGPPEVRVLSGCDQALAVAPIDVTPVSAAFAGGRPPGQSDLRVTGFGRVRLSKRWTPNLASSLSYRRQQSTASGLGGSTILDGVTARTEWEIDRWWDAELRFDYSHRESVGESTQSFLLVTRGANGEALAIDTPNDPGNPAGAVARVTKNLIDTDNFGIAGRVARQIGKRAEASLRVSYNKQMSGTNTRGRASDYDVVLAIFGVRYRFEPITVW